MQADRNKANMLDTLYPFPVKFYFTNLCNHLRQLNKMIKLKRSVHRHYLHWHRRNLREDDPVEVVEGSHLDEQLQDDDPEVEVEAADAEAGRSLADDQGPVLSARRSPQGYDDEEDGRQREADHQDHDVDEPW